MHAFVHAKRPAQQSASCSGCLDFRRVAGIDYWRMGEACVRLTVPQSVMTPSVDPSPEVRRRVAFLEKLPDRGALHRDAAHDVRVDGPSPPHRGQVSLACARLAFGPGARASSSRPFPFACASTRALTFACPWAFPLAFARASGSAFACGGRIVLRGTATGLAPPPDAARMGSDRLGTRGGDCSRPARFQ